LISSRQLVIIAVLVLGLSIPAAATARPQVQQNPSQCYRCTLDVDIVNVVVVAPGSGAPSSALVISFLQTPAGTPFVIQFHVVYALTPNGTGMAAVLNPERASFSFSNSSGASLTVTNVTVVPVTGQPGNYTYSSVVSSNFPDGPVTVSVLEGSLQDTQGNIGPPHDVTSDTTFTPQDNSHFNIGPVQTTTQPPTTNYFVPAVIAALIILALILFLARRRSTKKARKT
jgi:hypothetical protein